MLKIKPRIIIIGAGIAGLTAAHELKQYPFVVTVLEARNRIGGRIWKDESLGVPLSRGALWLHGIENNPLMPLAEQYNAKVIKFNLSKIINFNDHQQQIPPLQVEKFDKQFAKNLLAAKEFAFKQENDCSLAQALSQFINKSNFSHNEATLWERKLRFFDNYYGASYEKLSARYFDQEEVLPGGQGIMIDTYDPIIQGLAKDCDIRLHTEVTAINQRREDIEIIARNETFYADAVIITLPLGVLKSNTLKITPALPARKQQAIERLGMGLLDMVALQFSSYFWPNDAHGLFLTDTSPLPISTFFNLAFFLNEPILIAYTGAQVGEALENKDDDFIIEKIMQQLRKNFSNNIPYPENYFITRWSQDPFSKGSYSYLPVGATPDDFDLLAEPVSNRLYFAGEATHRHFSATTHGAYLSGIREAKSVMKNVLNLGDYKT